MTAARLNEQIGEEEVWLVKQVARGFAAASGSSGGALLTGSPVPGHEGDQLVGAPNTDADSFMQALDGLGYFLQEPVNMIPEARWPPANPGRAREPALPGHSARSSRDSAP